MLPPSGRVNIDGMPEAAAVPLDDPRPPRKLYRSSDGRWLGGVARGLAGHLGLPVIWVRLVFAGLFMADGLGALLYAAFWFFVPLGVGGVDSGRTPAFTTETAPDGRRRLVARKPDRGQIVALLLMVVVAMVFVGNVNLGGGARAYLWPTVLVGAGVALVWRQADNARRARWVEVGRRRRTLTLLRSAAGVLLVTAGVSGIFVLQGSAAHLGSVLQAALAVLVGTALLAGPYLVRMTQDLSEERLMRIRAQERDLRAWLYKPEGTGKDEADEPATLAEAVRRNAAEVEDKHGVPIEVVVVGDCPLDEGLTAQMQAAREAMVNAAKYGGEGGAVQVYAEVEGRTVFVSVRDRGPGFDLEGIPADRMGVRESIIGRMERNGGTARLRAVPDGGTEVELEMERAEKTS